MIYDLPHNWDYHNSILAHAIDMGPLGHYIVDAKEFTSYALTASDDTTLRFEVRANDFWTNDGTIANRAEIASLNHYTNGIPIKVNYNFVLESGADIISPWVVIGQLHQVDYAGEIAPTPPPVAIEMIGNKMGVQINWVEADNTQHTTIIYTDSVDLSRNSTHAMEIIANFVPSPILNGAIQGQLIVKRDGMVLCTYTGPLGITDNSAAPTDPNLNHKSSFWKQGIYRGASSETMAVRYSDLTISQNASYLTKSMTPALAANVVSSFEAFNAAGHLTRNEIYKSDDTSINYIYNGSSPNWVKDRYDYKAYPTLYSNQIAHYNYSASGKHHQDTVLGTLNGSNYSDVIDYDVNGIVIHTSRTYTSGPNNGVTSASTYTSGHLTNKFVRLANGSTQEDRYSLTTYLQTFKYVINADGSRINYNYGTYTPYQKGVACSAQSNHFDLTDGLNDYAICYSGGGNIFDFNVTRFGHVAITGFHTGSASSRDILNFKTTIVANYSTLRNLLTQVGSDAQFTLSDGSYIKLLNVSTSAFEPSNATFHP